MDLRVTHTRDGSTTLYHPKLNEHYHSIHGALTESRHVFITYGFREARALFETPLRILEAGFGTGLNAALTAAEAQTHGCTTGYVALEPFPVPTEVLNRLGYDQILPADAYACFEKIHQLPWESPQPVNARFSLEKRTDGIAGMPGTEAFHLIYFDAFAPEKQPDMWTPEVLQICHRLLVPGGIFVTYCAKGQFKRNLKACGFRVQAKPGPPGKREITVAVK